MRRKWTSPPPEAEPQGGRPGGTPHWAEAAARAFLEEAGMVFLAANHREKGGELDLVMKDGPETVFVEVRQRKSAAFGSAAESLDAAKLRRLTRTARLFLLRHYGHEDVPCRFDAVLLSGGEAAYTVGHVRGLIIT